MLARLDQRLPLLVAAARDLPDRQRTIEATIEWSIDLLEPEPRALLIRLGVFAGDFSLDAVEAVGAGRAADADSLVLLTELIDNSLVRPRDLARLPLFGMLATVREYARGLLESTPGRRGGATRCTPTTTPGWHWRPRRCCRGARSSSALAQLGAERDNLRAAGRHLLESGAVDTLSRVVWDLFLYWWIRGLMPEARGWMDAILATGIPVSDSTRAIALGFSSWVSLWQQRGGVGPGPFEESVALFHASATSDSEALALSSLALAYLAEVPPDLDRAEESAARRARDRSRAGRRRSSPWRRSRSGACASSDGDLARGRALVRRGARAGRGHRRHLRDDARDHESGWMAIALGDPRGDLFERNLVLATQLGNVDGAAYALEGLIAIAVLERRHRARRRPHRRGRDRAAAHRDGRAGDDRHLRAVRGVGPGHRRRTRLRGGTRPRTDDDRARGDRVRARDRRRADRRTDTAVATQRILQ